MGIINSIKSLRIKAYIALYRLLPIVNNKIILWANSFKQYGCSPKYITEHILRKYPGKFKIVWVFENGIDLPKSLPRDVKVVRYFSLAYLKELHTAHFIICNMRTGSSYLWDKRKGQKYIQTWHSSLRLKKIEKDAEENLPDTYINSAKEDSSKIDLLISGCDFSTRIFSESFWYKGLILKSGTPRCDLFFSDNECLKQKVSEALKIDSSYKILLYAPTFRNDKKASLHGLDFHKITDALSDRFGGKWIVAYRFHPNILDNISHSPEGVNASKYSDMQELIAASDILVTDYSSCMFDMAIADKPCFLYAPDLNEYVKRERGLYFNPFDLPFPIACSNDDFIRLIERFDSIQYHAQLNAFLKSIGTYEKGNASEQVMDYILKNLK